MIQAHKLFWGNFGSRGLESQDVCSIKLQRFKVDKRDMLLDVSSIPSCSYTNLETSLFYST